MSLFNVHRLGSTICIVQYSRASFLDNGTHERSENDVTYVVKSYLEMISSTAVVSVIRLYPSLTDDCSVARVVTRFFLGVDVAGVVFL